MVFSGPYGSYDEKNLPIATPNFSQGIAMNVINTCLKASYQDLQMKGHLPEPQVFFGYNDDS